MIIPLTLRQIPLISMYRIILLSHNNLIFSGGNVTRPHRYNRKKLDGNKLQNFKLQVNHV